MKTRILLGVLFVLVVVGLVWFMAPGPRPVVPPPGELDRTLPVAEPPSVPEVVGTIESLTAAPVLTPTPARAARPATAEWVADATATVEALALYAHNVIYIAPVVDEGEKYALLQTRQAYGLLLYNEGQNVGPGFVLSEIADDHITVRGGQVERVLYRRYKPLEAGGAFFNLTGNLSPEEYLAKLEDYKKRILPTLGRPRIIMRQMDELRLAEAYTIDGRGAAGGVPGATRAFASSTGDVWFLFGQVARTWGAVLDVSRSIECSVEIPAGSYTLAGVMAVIDARCPTASLVEGDRVAVGFEPRSFSERQGRRVDPRLRKEIENLLSANLPAKTVVDIIAQAAGLTLEMDPAIAHRGVSMRMTRGSCMEALETVLPRVGAKYYVEGDVLHVEPAAATVEGGS